MPSLRQLEYLVALSETRHFRKAAEKTGVSQPTLSAQISTLEQRLGVSLVERGRNAILLTDAGRRIEQIARQMLRQAQEIRDIATTSQGRMGGTVRLGLAPTIGPYLLPRLLPELHAEHPAFKMHVRENKPEALAPALIDGSHDVILAPLPLRGHEIDTRPLFREPLFVVVAEDHPLADRQVLDRNDLQGQDVLALESGHQLHEQVEQLCAEFGARLRFDFEGTSLDTLRQMVALGMGISFLPGVYVQTVLTSASGVVALPLSGRGLFRTIGMGWRRTSPRTADFGMLGDLVQATVARDFPGFPRL
ncbi:MAG: hydrogen peroxide-inducible genes activator [Minwuia sp.]|nr:hydrogen peroxide-inducible genes activator [Minwuia sp.]